MIDILIHFSEEIIKIFILMYIATFIVALLKNIFSPEKIQKFIENKNRMFGYLTAVIMGLFTPFCPCSSIPVFIGFIAAKIPIGVSLAFLISSPLLSEMSIIILPTIEKNGWFLLFIYILTGTIISVLAGYLADKLKLNKEIIIQFPQQKDITKNIQNKNKSIFNILKSANFFAINTMKNIAPYIIFALAIGFIIKNTAANHFILSHITGKNWFEVPLATIIGAPFDASHGSLMPLIKSLIEQKVAIGTVMAFLMSATTMSIPNLIMLKKIFSTKLMIIFTGYLLISFIITGYLLNNIQ